MKKILALLSLVIFISATKADAQCSGGYTAASLNWDNLDFLKQDATYISASAAQTQYFAFGSGRLTISHNYASSFALGETLNQTGKTGSYAAGADVEFSGNGTITLTFSSPVYNLKFSIQDVEKGQTMSITAFNGVTPTITTLSTCASAATTYLTLLGNSSTNPSVRSLDAKNVGSVANNTNLGSFNIDVAGPVTTISIVTTVIPGGYNPNQSGDNPDFFLSDISACIGTPVFPSSYYAVSQPFINQPGYVLAALDDSVFYINPANGNAKLLFREPTGNNINSMGYDPYNKFLYYTYSLTSGGAVNANDKSIQKYDVNTGVFSTVVSNVNTLGIPTYSSGVESGGAAFYNGALYIGIEGINGDESKIWRIDFDGSFNPIIPAYQVFAIATDDHDWGDFAISNGTLYDFDGKSGGAFENIYHYNLQTGVTTSTYNSGALGFVPRQIAIDWAGNIYNLGTAATSSTGTIVPYSNGAINTAQQYTIVKNSIAPSGSWGDAAEAFKPRVDFGDAPASYDPVTGDPAVHEISSTLYLGSNTDDEWTSRGQTALANSDNFDDGVVSGSLVNPSAGTFFAQVRYFNNTGTTATICAWVDFNNNGLFDPGEGLSQTNLPSSASPQTAFFNWTGVATSLVDGSYTYLRLRITTTANGMTTSNPTGYFNIGEVEDHRLIVTTSALATQLIKFTATKKDHKVFVNWLVTNEEEGLQYTLQRSVDDKDWIDINSVQAATNASGNNYNFLDAHPLNGTSYYRLKMTKNATIYSAVRKIEASGSLSIQLLPNPASNIVSVIVNAEAESSLQLQLLDASGRVIQTQTATVALGLNKLPLQVAHLPNGLYWVQILIGDERHIERLLIKK